MFGKKLREELDYQKRKAEKFREMMFNERSDYHKVRTENCELKSEKAALEYQINSLKARNVDLIKERDSKSNEIKTLSNELEQFYLKAIGDCKTVKQVKKVLSKYHKSSLFKRDMVPLMGKIIIGSLSLFGKNPDSPIGTSVQLAATTKIKRINKRDVSDMSVYLDNLQEEDKSHYASEMASMLKSVANIEVDRKKILDAWEAGLDAYSVFLSMLSAYNIKQENVLGAN
nr:hypothetical protein [uncultured Sphaerochaeta sp.]